MFILTVTGNVVLPEAINWGLLSNLSSSPSQPSPQPSPSGRGSERRGGQDEEILLTIQPVFPYFLRTKLNELNDATREALREGFKNHYLGLARSYRRWMESKEPQRRQLGVFFCRLEYENLYNALQICLEKQETVDIFFCLAEYLKLINDIQSRLKLSEFVCHAQVAYPSELHTGEIGLEIVMALDRLAFCYLKTQNYPQARESYLKVVELTQQLRGVDERQKQSGLAASTYHQLGYVAQELREWEQAKAYYQKALDIKIEFSDRFSQARTYHCLGLLAEAQEDYAEARANLQTALEIYVEYQDEYMAGVAREVLERLPELG